MSIYKNFTGTTFEIWQPVEKLSIQELKDQLIEVNLMIFQIEKKTFQGVDLNAIKDYRGKVTAELFSKLEADFLTNRNKA
ncbi:hypothetical protein [Salinivibrio sp. ML290]|uniref:hypothetical protein n=1 Tax=Salinivibrio sp. ML290 TaxID=1909468 RepID=UPI0009883D43|nr:hypothetical protein [Salinivibrio sp. ML290]OOE76335.1 hypothetical protein BZG23_02495 [Salinivibrio sp. ML290]